VPLLLVVDVGVAHRRRELVYIGAGHLIVLEVIVPCTMVSVIEVMMASGEAEAMP
jgi:hypothetical protein